MFDLFFGDKVTIFMTNDRYHAVVVWADPQKPRVAVMSYHWDEPEFFARNNEGVWRGPMGLGKLELGWLGEYQNPDI